MATKNYFRIFLVKILVKIDDKNDEFWPENKIVYLLVGLKFTTADAIPDKWLLKVSSFFGHFQNGLIKNARSSPLVTPINMAVPQPALLNFENV